MGPCSEPLFDSGVCSMGPSFVHGASFLLCIRVQIRGPSLTEAHGLDCRCFAAVFLCVEVTTKASRRLRTQSTGQQPTLREFRVFFCEPMRIPSFKISLFRSVVRSQSKCKHYPPVYLKIYRATCPKTRPCFDASGNVPHFP